MPMHFEKLKNHWKLWLDKKIIKRTKIKNECQITAGQFFFKNVFENLGFALKNAHSFAKFKDFFFKIVQIEFFFDKRSKNKKNG